MTNTNSGQEARLFILNGSARCIISVRTDGKGRQVIEPGGMRIPDGIAVDPLAGHIFWTNMGIPNQNDGSIERCDLDGSNRVNIVPSGVTHTPKQLKLESVGGWLYWCDREGMRVMRARTDGTGVETLIQTGEGPADMAEPRNWCVGIAVDAGGNALYWSQKGGDDLGQGRIFRAPLEVPAGTNPRDRVDIEILLQNLPEPIDLELDVLDKVLYWTDRGDPPFGNTVNRMALGRIATSPIHEILHSHLMEGIGLALDENRSAVYFGDLGGSVYSSAVDGSHGKTLLFGQGNLTGIAFASVAATLSGG